MAGHDPERIALQRREGGKLMVAKVTPAETRFSTDQTKEKIESARRSIFRETRNRKFQRGSKPFIAKRALNLANMTGRMRQ